MFLEGRPPVNVGVTSNGDIFGGSQISFGDMTGDRQFNVFIASISQYRTMAASYVNLVAALPVRAPGILADDVLLRAGQQRRLLRPGVYGVHRPRPRPGDSNRPRRNGARHLSAQSLPPCPVFRRLRQPQRAVQRSGPRSARRRSISSRPTGSTLFSNGIDDPARRRIRPGNDGVPRIRTARGQHRAARVRRRRPSIGEPAVAPDHRRRPAALPAARLQRPARDALQGVQELRRVSRTSPTSAATRSCAATTTCSSPDRTPCSPTPSCASR